MEDGSAVYLDRSDLTFVNANIGGNDATALGLSGALTYATPDPIAASYSNLWGDVVDWEATAPAPMWVDGNIAVDPAYLDTTGSSHLFWDLHLRADSSLIDAGDPSILDADGSRSDIGAFGGPGGADWL